LPLLCQNVEVNSVFGIDKMPCSYVHEKFSCTAMDISSPELRATMNGMDAVVHLAFGVMRGAMSDEELFDNNVRGTLNVFYNASRCGIEKIVNISSVSVYGSGLDLDESTPFNPAHAFAYAKHKAEIERVAAKRHPNIIHLRSHLVFGKHCHDFLKNMVNARLYIAPPAPHPVTQVIHEQDVARAIELALARDVQGAFNLAAPQITSLPDLVRRGRRFICPLSLGVAKKAVAIAKLFGNRDEFTWLDVLGTSLTVRCDRANEYLGWYPQYSAWEAREEMIVV